MYAIRFLPIDPRDPSPALYMSTDRVPWERVHGRKYRGAVRLTSIPADVQPFVAEWWTANALRNGAVIERCDAERLRADVVPLADALRDLEAT